MASTSPDLRRSAMMHVQRVALDLMERRGFDAVTVTEIATVSGVAPRTVYRYFGTKEGIALWNTGDLAVLERVASHLATMPLRQAARAAVDAVEDDFPAPARELSARQVAVLDSSPALRAHFAASLLEAGTQLGAALARARSLPTDDEVSRLEATLLVTTLILAALNWERTGRGEPLAAALSRALDVLDRWGRT